MTTIINAIVGAVLSKLAGWFTNWLTKHEAHVAKVKAINGARDALKNATTKEEQENAAAELIRITTPND